MKISIITCHNVYNYGASLQAYALQAYLTNLSNEVNIIDYRPTELYNTYSFWYIPLTDKYYAITKKFKLLKLVYCVMLASSRFVTWRRILPFKVFTKSRLLLTHKYESFNELVANPPVADIYIAGSDQIWNTKIGNGLDCAFYLDFGPQNIRRVSYAASFAMKSIPENHVKFVKEEISKLDFVTVREQTGKTILDGLGINSELVCDPVFLLNRDEWAIIEKSVNVPDSYVLLYILNPGNIKLLEIAKRISAEMGLAIVSVDAIIPNTICDKRVKNAGPSEFVFLIRNASYVITDSFHGTAFSLIFNIPLYVNISHENNSRIQDLLSYISLPNYLNADNPYYHFDWDFINSKISSMVVRSKEIISDIIKIK